MHFVAALSATTHASNPTAILVRVQYASRNSTAFELAGSREGDCRNLLYKPKRLTCTSDRVDAAPKLARTFS